MSLLRFDYTNVLAEVVGPEHGIREDELAALADPTRAAVEAVQARRTADLRWLDLPYQDEVVGEILDYADGVQGRFENVVVLGIGGSALGTLALQSALNSPYHNLFPDGVPRLFVLDNVDPDLVGEFLETIDPSKTLFNVISKSGGTAETMSQFLIFRKALIDAVGQDAHDEHIVVTTDAEKGVLREICAREGYESFVVPDGVGGRFSVLCPVGLLPLALAGIDVKGVLDGARAMDERCRSTSMTENPAALHAAVQWLMQSAKQKPLAVTFAYSQRLALLADWYAQLLAESIGKKTTRAGELVYAGPTPVRALGVTDQHSQVQLYVEGPFDKWFQLLSVDAPDHAVEIPPAADLGALDGVDYLYGRSLGELFHAERDGTRIALTEAGRPNATFHFPAVTPNVVGQFLQCMQVSVALMGEHYDVNAFDQPGVEAGKIAAYALMGRAGYEERRAQIEAASARTPRVI
jgi:glucose-6-phosphate isomerase